MLGSLREFENARIITAEGSPCGRIKDFYFDDSLWALTHLVASVREASFAPKSVLIRPDQVAAVNEGMIRLRPLDLRTAPLESSVLPVCRQYASIALSSPASARFPRNISGANLHLRSARAVRSYTIVSEGASVGSLADFLLDARGWKIRALVVEESLQGKTVRFHILPETVERFTWAGQRVTLRRYQPVAIAEEAEPQVASRAA